MYFLHFVLTPHYIIMDKDFTGLCANEDCWNFANVNFLR